VNWQEIASRLTGFSIPVFGVSWTPPEADRAVARRVITFLEDRRVLYVPSEMEVPDYCVRSVLEIRAYLTSELQRIPSEKDLAQSLRAMRTACRKFLDTVQADDLGIVVRHANYPGHWASWKFNGAVGELRGVFGLHIASIAARYGLDVEDDLAAILPASGEEETAATA
jgi:hypothetical protein